MSYCRWGQPDSDIYVYYASDYWLVCCGCCLKAGPNADRGNLADARFQKYSEMLAHMAEHTNLGHKVSPRALVTLETEKRQNGNILRQPGVR